MANIINLRFQITKARVESAVAEGKALKVDQVVDIDLDQLTETQRNLLSRHLGLVSDAKTGLEYFRLTADGPNQILTAYSEELQGVLKTLEDYENRKSEELQKRTDEINQKLEKFIAGTTEHEPMRILGEGIYDDWSGSFNFMNLRYQYDRYENEYGRLSIDYTTLEAKAQEYIKIQEVKKAERQAAIEKREQEKAEKQAAHEAVKEELRQWAIKNGSELLKLRIEEGFNWFDLAHEEWFLTHTPEGWEPQDNYETDECWDYNNPTLEHIQALRDARKVVESPELLKCRFADVYGNKTFYYFVAANLKAPTERTFQIVKLLDTEEISNEDDDE